MKRRIYIISPCRKEDIWRKRRATFVLPQMSLAILAALTPDTYEVKVTDELVDDIDFDYPADLLAITTNSTNALRAYAVAGRFREKGSKIVMGGIHPSVMPDEVLTHADAILIGEAEEMWQKILDDYLSGRLEQLYRCTAYPAPESIPSGRWEVIHQKRYYVPRTFQTSRGCPYGCSFCSSTQFFGTKQRCRPIGNIISELKDYNRRLAVFVDDNIAGNSAYAKELFRALKPLKQRWVAQTSIDIARDNELLRLAAESGCAGLLIGFESVNAKNSTDVKKLRKAEQYAEHIREIRAAGIGVHGSFIFGFDHDTPDIFDSTVDFVMQNRLEVANFCKLTPFPGTRLFEEMSAEGRILHRNWEKYDRYNIVFSPKNISAEELHQKTLEAYMKIYSPGSILKRMPSRLQNILPYFAMNISYRLGSKRLRRS
ncbi:MAG: B12-binding domain-containing radical SAM protein [Nitrospirae bacterium]|nr:B12-binding domain-containing radical SAM protein [Nitrospirota bacterium]